MIEKVYVIVSYRTYPFLYTYWNPKTNSYDETLSFVHTPGQSDEENPPPTFFGSHDEAERVIRSNDFFEDKLVSILEIFVPESWV